VILVYGPATILFVFVVFERPLATAEASEIIRIVILGESQRLSQLLTAWHTSPCCVSIYRAESR
jgi:hypothetical protein